MKGFSLVETVVVIAIIAVLVAVFAPVYVKYVEKARRVSDVEAMEEICKATVVAGVECDSGGDVYVAVFPKSAGGDTLIFGGNALFKEKLESMGITSKSVCVRSRESEWKHGFVVFYSESSGSCSVRTIKSGKTPRAFTYEDAVNAGVLFEYDYISDKLTELR